MNNKVEGTKVTSTMLFQLISYCEYIEAEGWYYGNKHQFEARHKNIIDWLKSIEVAL